MSLKLILSHLAPGPGFGLVGSCSGGCCGDSWPLGRHSYSAQVQWRRSLGALLHRSWRVRNLISFHFIFIHFVCAMDLWFYLVSLPWSKASSNDSGVLSGSGGTGEGVQAGETEIGMNILSILGILLWAVQHQEVEEGSSWRSVLRCDVWLVCEWRVIFSPFTSKELFSLWENHSCPWKITLSWSITSHYTDLLTPQLPDGLGSSVRRDDEW